MRAYGQTGDRSIEKAVHEHFDESQADEIVRRSEQMRLYKELPDCVDDEDVAAGPALVHPTARRLSLRAYLASALTGLSDEQRRIVFDISDRINQICLEADI